MRELQCRVQACIGQQVVLRYVDSFACFSYFENEILREFATAKTRFSLYGQHVALRTPRATARDVRCPVAMVVGR